MSRIEWIESSTDHFHPSEFWCEIFEGEHLSIDYQNGEPKLSVRGERNSKNPLYQWDKWEKTDQWIEFPPILFKLKGTYEWINCEFIGNHLIEVQFRPNSDFRYGNSIAIPIWEDNIVSDDASFTFVRDEDYLRKGFLIN
jgi:hypothetical protein